MRKMRCSSTGDVKADCDEVPVRHNSSSPDFCRQLPEGDEMKITFNPSNLTSVKSMEKDVLASPTMSGMTVQGKP